MFRELLIIALLMTATANAAPVYQNVKVVKVIDGNTLEVKMPQGRMKADLKGIDCFESAKVHRAYHQAYDNSITLEDVILRGKEAKKILKALIKQNKNEVTFDFQGIDVRGRALGIFYVKDRNLNEEMKNTGLCPEYCKH